MTERWRKFLVMGASLFILLAGGFLVIRQGIWHANAKKYRQSQVPTLYLHGYGSSYKAEESLVKAALNSGASSGVIRANVSKSGKVSLKGKFTTNVNNPLVEVNFADNKNGNYYQDGAYLKAVVEKLQARYQIKQFNVVAHSMGNMAVAYYLLDNGQDKNLPRLNKQVSLAGHYNGILDYDAPKDASLRKDGAPKVQTNSYQALLPLKKRYPKQVAVLNIYGDLNDGSHSDGRVANASSKSLAYLVADRAASYQELVIKGKGGQHSRLHENRRVAQQIVNFLFLKS